MNYTKLQKASTIVGLAGGILSLGIGVYQVISIVRQERAARLQVPNYTNDQKVE